MPDLFIRPGISIPETELSVQFARSGGPGGQNVNKVETKVEVRFAPGRSTAFREADREWLLRRLAGKLTSQGELIVVSERTRNQARNRADALVKLADMLREALQRPKLRRPTRPGRGAVQRRLDAKKHRSRVKRQRGSSDMD